MNHRQSTNLTVLDSCGCCDTADEPAPVHNAPGLEALSYRIDTQPGFRERMLQRLPLSRSNPREAESPRPLAQLLTRSNDDPTIALVDAAACVADVLTFYQERIANEGFLRTATERRSVLELARAIGYELNPGVAASVYLAFTVEDAPGAPGITTLAMGTAVQSVPPQDVLPQVFETTDEIVAHAAWNALRPRHTRPADMALLDLSTDDGDETSPSLVLALLGPVGSFPANTPGLHENLLSADLFRLDGSIAVDKTVDVLEIQQVSFSQAANRIEGGDLLLFVGTQGKSVKTLVLRATAVVEDAEQQRVHVDVEPLPAPVANPTPPPVQYWVMSTEFQAVPYAMTLNTNFATPQTSTITFNANAIIDTVASHTWRESDLQAMIGIQGWNALELEAVFAAPAMKQPQSPGSGAFSFSATLGFFGHNAPKWKTLPSGASTTNGQAYPEGWDNGDALFNIDRTIWQDSQGDPLEPAPITYLERAVLDVTKGSWVVFDATDEAAKAYTVLDAREASRADYGLSGRAMRLSLADETGSNLPSTPAEPFSFRDTTAHVASSRLDLAALPIDLEIAKDDERIELDRMVLGLSKGQHLALTGERADLPGVTAEIAILKEILHADGRSTLVLQQGLINSYVRASLTINANVAHATHGESVDEVLGNGDASLGNQRFTLKQPPVTYLSAIGGAASTLEVRVAGVLWEELPSLYDAAPDRPAYMTRIDDDASLHMVFGDGLRGARLPSGTLNVTARYRSGIGLDGEVAAGTLTMPRALPLGLRGVTNPLAASGSENPEQLDDARQNAPLTLSTFERVVSLSDYQSFARAFPGIGKARGDVLWVDGRPQVFLTVAGASGGAPGADVLNGLMDSIAAASDPGQRFTAGVFVQRYFSLGVRIAVDPRYVADDVLNAVRATLLAGYDFKARELGQSVTAAEVIALMHTVAGVVAIDLDVLRSYTDSELNGNASPETPSLVDPLATAAPAVGARWDAVKNAPEPAELLLVNPAGIDLAEMPA